MVDDEPVVANLVAHQISSDGYKVDIANDGVEGVLPFIGNDYAFVVLDIAMPKLGGNDALRIMKAVKPQVPIVTVTGHVGRGEMVETVKMAPWPAWRSRTPWISRGRRLPLASLRTAV